jgi:hypothetical protein
MLMIRIWLITIIMMLTSCSKSDDEQIKILVAQRPPVIFQVGWSKPTTLSAQQRDAILEILSLSAAKATRKNDPSPVSFAHFTIGDKTFLLFGPRLEYVGSKDCFWWSDPRLSSMNEVLESHTGNIGDIDSTTVDKMLKCLEK